MNTLMNVHKPKGEQGFTLIELMIAIAIVGVLAAIAVPQFTNYLARARVSEAVNLAQSCKTGFLEFYSTRGTFPVNAAEAGCTTVQTENVQSITVAGGTAPRITVTLVNAAPLPAQIRGARIVLQPLATPGTPGAVAPLATEGTVVAGWNCAALAGGNNNNRIAAAGQVFIPSVCNNPART